MWVVVVSALFTLASFRLLFALGVHCVFFRCLNMDSCAYAFLVAPRNWCRTLSTCVRLESFSKFGTVWMKST